MGRYAPLGAIRVGETRLTRASGLIQPIVSTRPSLIHTLPPGHHLTSVVKDLSTPPRCNGSIPQCTEFLARRP